MFFLRDSSSPFLKGLSTKRLERKITAIRQLGRAKFKKLYNRTAKLNAMADEGKSKRLETAIEVMVILAFFTAILFLGPASASEHRLKHDYPVGYAASDSYQHQSRAEAIKEMGQYRNEAPHMMAGLTDVVGFYPPVLYHVAVL